jgi:hypothetical protein
MIWATFEHVGNAPNAAYTYETSTGQKVTEPQDTSGTWLFCDPKCAEPFNQAHMGQNGDDIDAAPPTALARRIPFGGRLGGLRTG